MKRTNAQRGALARALGKGWERTNATHIAVARVRGIVGFAQHAEPEMGYRKPKKEGEEGKIFHKAAGFADFSGHLIGGLAFALECKSKMVSTYYHSDISESQLEHLDAVQRDGGLALFALQLTDEQGYRRGFVERWDRFPWRTKKSALSVSIEDLAGLDLVGDCLFEKFLKACELCRSMHILSSVRPQCPTCWRVGASSAP